MAHDIFISYAPPDRTTAESVCRRLEAAGFLCWIAPRDIGGGVDWDLAIEDSPLVVLIFSAAANVSRQVRDEVALAVEIGAGIVVFGIDGSEPTGALRLRLTHRPWIDASMSPFDAHIDPLIVEAAQILPPRDIDVTEPAAENIPAAPLKVAQPETAQAEIAQAEVAQAGAAPAEVAQAEVAPVERPRGRRFAAMLAGLTALALLAIGGWLIGGVFNRPPARQTSYIPAPSAQPATPIQPAAPMQPGTPPQPPPSTGSTEPQPPLAPLSAPSEPASSIPAAPVRVLEGHDGAVNAVAVAPDGRTLSSGSDDRSLKFWSVASGTEFRTLSTGSTPVAAIAFAPDGSLLAWSSGRVVAGAGSAPVIWMEDVATGKVARTLNQPAGGEQAVYGPSAIAFSPNGTLLAAGGEDRSIQLWDVASGKLVRSLPGHSKGTLAVAFSPDGRWLASGGGDSAVKLWDVATGQPLRSMTAARWVRAVAFSPDGKILASAGEDRAIRLWDPASGQLVRTLTGHSRWVRSIAFSRDGRLIASGGQDKLVKVWDVASGRETNNLTGHTEPVFSVAFAPDGHTLASGGADAAVRLWDLSLISQASR